MHRFLFKFNYKITIPSEAIHNCRPLQFTHAMFSENNASAPPSASLEPPPVSAPATGIPVNQRFPLAPVAAANFDRRRRSPHEDVQWSTGLCDCCDNLSICCLTCWCPCITFGRIAEIVDRGSTSCGVSGALYSMITCLGGWCWLYSCLYRSKLRGQYYLEERPCADCCVHWCCETCALCQEYRHLLNQGLDPSIGWHGNLERRKRKAAIPPSVQEGMKH